MTKVCDHTSVGMIVRRGDKILLIERRKYPFGYALPAGHVDGDKSFEEAAKRELKEEVGLKATKLKLVYEGRKQNKCRRPDGSWHYWKVYEVEAEGTVKRSPDETKKAGWYTRREIKELAGKTGKYLDGEIPDDEWQKSPGMEQGWYELGKELNI
jgi:ADP-ribose pyrophosphatase YjhB (NUDIX family)